MGNNEYSNFRVWERPIEYPFIKNDKYVIPQLFSFIAFV